ncbi:unnamed protein product [Leptosia nina]|uniref:Non-homologous end-joining factor 1 n=1 Tax=Leptosia nina TaxID=320188 RepID=A0AAV1JDM8_9NEOP
MWKNLHKALPYYLLFIKDEYFEISITDYVKIWIVRLNLDEFTSHLKESNLGLEIHSNELIENGIHMLLYPEELKSATVSNKEDKLEVTLCKSFGYPLKFKVLLSIGSQELFFQKIIQPLLKTIQDLHSSESELRSILKNKDKEIEEYKLEAGEICLRYLKTKPFNDKAHMEKHYRYDNYFGSATIPDGLLDKSVDIPKETMVKRDIKSEPTSQVIENDPVIPKVEIKEEHIKIEPQSALPVKRRKIRLNI